MTGVVGVKEKAKPSRRMEMNEGSWVIQRNEPGSKEAKEGRSVSWGGRAL